MVDAVTPLSNKHFVRCLGREWHFADNLAAPAFVGDWAIAVIARHGCGKPRSRLTHSNF